jgi:hypothetical protein
VCDRFFCLNQYRCLCAKAIADLVVLIPFLFEVALNILSLNLAQRRKDAKTQRRLLRLVWGKGVKFNLVHCYRELVLGLADS